MGYDKLGAGNLFKNDKATEENKQPHWKGSVDFEGRTIGIAGWERGDKMYFAFSEKIMRPGEEAPPPETATDPELPF